MSRCKGCGKEIVWGVTDEGKKIPLDPSAPVYYVSDEQIETPQGMTPKIERERQHMVSHFKTCPNAADFSKGRRG